jgi:DNA-binding CsgD family transcriptional regulator
VLGIAVKTVEAHRASAFVKLGVRTQAQAIAHLVGDPTILNGRGK